MKLFKKIIFPVIAGVCTLAALAAFTACGDGSETSASGDDSNVTSTTNSDDSLTDTQYVVYVYLDDGTTPVEGVTFQLCYSTSESKSTCSGTAYETDSNGRVLFDMTGVTYVDVPVIHITTKYVLNDIGVYEETYACLPDGYGIPSDASEKTLNDGASYEDAWELTQRVTILTLTKV